jgi:phosphohistidine swiveling domain-containing protein
MTTDKPSHVDSMPVVVPFSEADDFGVSELGSKAATLIRLTALGFPVPTGLVVTPAAEERWEEASEQLQQTAAELDGQRFAVRSSGIAEDLEDASYAGQYETVLDVSLDELSNAVRQIFDSATAERVSAYQETRGDASEEDPASRMAVLVQSMVDADAAGVGFTANPVTGERNEVVLTAVRGLGERLVSGTAVGDEWVVTGNNATCRRSQESAISDEQARALATLARRVEEHFGSPQDIEWAIDGDRLFLLQARPMTALPDPVEWEPPYEGWWMRNFRLGEWLPEPVTPLFADWLLPEIEAGFATAAHEDLGVPHEPDSTIINGWYYTTPLGKTSIPTLASHLLRTPSALLAMKRFLIDPGRQPEKAAGALERATRKWRDELLPRYQTIVDEGEEKIEHASPAELVSLVDDVGKLAGEQFWSLSLVGGSAWKIEGRLAQFYQDHLKSTVERSPQVLVSGLPGIDHGPTPHSVYSADWYWPTAGKHAGRESNGQADNRSASLADRREAAETECRAALANEPKKLRRFDRLLDLAQQYAVIREQQANSFTLGWPLLRSCAVNLGETFVERGTIAEPDDVFFITREELEAEIHDDQSANVDDTVQGRQSEWDRQRRLRAPLELGTPPLLAKKLVSGAIEAAKTSHEQPEGAIIGQPASPGQATGTAHVVLNPDEFDQFQPGEVLVARATTPAWTPLFARAAAVVTDGGSLAAHASLVAREYGIPAVVGAEDATLRLHDGQTVTVNGGTGVVELIQ